MNKIDPAAVPPFTMLWGLLRARRFAGLFWCQFFSVFNDNFVRNMLAMLILFRLGETPRWPTDHARGRHLHAALAGSLRAWRRAGRRA